MGLVHEVVQLSHHCQCQVVHHNVNDGCGLENGAIVDDCHRENAECLEEARKKGLVRRIKLPTMIQTVLHLDEAFVQFSGKNDLEYKACNDSRKGDIEVGRHCLVCWHINRDVDAVGHYELD